MFGISDVICYNLSKTFCFTILESYVFRDVCQTMLREKDIIMMNNFSIGDDRSSKV